MGSVRIASPADVDQIVQVFRSGFAVELWNYTKFGCSGIHQYLIDQIEIQGFSTTSLFLVHDEDYRINGVAEFRRDPNRLFLNHIYVLPDDRRKGIGLTLMQQGIKLARNHKQTGIELDVFSDNHRALDWYLSLGFEPTYTQIWAEKTMSPLDLEDRLWWNVTGLAEANHIQDIYGFSQFGLMTERGNYSVGRLGDSLFRSLDSSILDDVAALEALCSIDPSRKLLIVGVFDKSTTGSRDIQILAMSNRLSGTIDQVLSRKR